MSDIVTARTFVDGEKGITATKLNDIIGSSVIQPAFYSAKPSTSTLDPTDQLLDLKGSGSYATITGQHLIDSVAASVNQAITPTIWSVRLRSFQALGNPAFEIDQRNVGAMLTNPVSTAFAQDRWQVQRSALTGTVNTQQFVPTSPIAWPGTNFAITRNYLRCTVGTAQTSLAAADFFALNQFVEGPRWRELSLDVHSVSLLVRTTVAGLVFGLYLRDPSGPPIRSLTKLCTIPSANTWTLIALPNLPLWAAGGAWTSAPGSVGYTLGIGLAAGTTLTAPVNDTWQNGNFAGAVGQSNFLATAGATFDVAFVSHEPGNQCSNPPQDCPWQQAYDDSLRYFQKSFDYEVGVGTAATAGIATFWQQATTLISGPAKFHKPMAKIPTVTAYNHGTGAANSVRFGGVDYAISSAQNVGKSGFGGFVTATLPAVVAGATAVVNYTADTGW